MSAPSPLLSPAGCGCVLHRYATPRRSPLFQPVPTGPALPDLPRSSPCRPSRRCVSVIRGEASDSLREGGQIEACQEPHDVSADAGQGVRVGLLKAAQPGLGQLRHPAAPVIGERFAADQSLPNQPFDQARQDTAGQVRQRRASSTNTAPTCPPSTSPTT